MLTFTGSNPELSAAFPMPTESDKSKEGFELSTFDLGAQGDSVYGKSNTSTGLAALLCCLSLPAICPCYLRHSHLTLNTINLVQMSNVFLS